MVSTRRGRKTRPVESSSSEGESSGYEQESREWQEDPSASLDGGYSAASDGGEDGDDGDDGEAYYEVASDAQDDGDDEDSQDDGDDEDAQDDGDDEDGDERVVQTGSGSGKLSMDFLAQLDADADAEADAGGYGGYDGYGGEKTTKKSKSMGKSMGKSKRKSKRKRKRGREVDPAEEAIALALARSRKNKRAKRKASAARTGFRVETLESIAAVSTGALRAEDANTFMENMANRVTRGRAAVVAAGLDERRRQEKLTRKERALQAAMEAIGLSLSDDAARAANKEPIKIKRGMSKADKIRIRKKNREERIRQYEASRKRSTLDTIFAEAGMDK